MLQNDTKFAILQVKNEDSDFGWGVVVNFSKKTNVKVQYYVATHCFITSLSGRYAGSKDGAMHFELIGMDHIDFNIS